MERGLTPPFVREPGSRKILFRLSDVMAREEAATHASTAAECARARTAQIQTSKGATEGDET